MRALVFALLLGVAIFLADRTQGIIPAFGRFLNPWQGVWARALAKNSGTLRFAGLKGQVVIRTDDEGIKHIFAENDEDLYFAQGYATAADRLWQMDFLTRLASGRLSEIFGNKTLEFDRLFKKIGMLAAAQESTELILADSLTRTAVNSYNSGVDAYLHSLKPEEYPFEFKLLGYAPESWSPVKVALLLKFMAFNLAGYSRDLPLTRSQSRIASDDFALLFPLNPDISDPIFPKGTVWNFSSFSPPIPKNQFRPNLGDLEPVPSPHSENGSNNWAVAGRKSSTGHPILSNDIHLEYRLPALWYEVQLVSPNQNVYGISLPGTPGVVLGFNRNLSWGVTNGGSDVLDWLELRFRDEKKREYLYEGTWRPVIIEDADIKVRGAETQHLSLRRTHWGPILYDTAEAPIGPWIPRGLAMRWGPLAGSNEIKALLKINQASSVKECKAALADFNWPDQNFLCADSSDIGLFHNGQYPIRWKGQGRTILDGSSRESDWSGWVPRDQIPMMTNPERGFLSSANQAPTDRLYPYYLGASFAEPYRAERINQILRSKEKFSPQDFIEMQGDTEQTLAVELKPLLLHWVSKFQLTDRQKAMLSILNHWDNRFDIDSTGASIFWAWRHHFMDDLWSETFPDNKAYEYPTLFRSIQLLRDKPDLSYFHKKPGSSVETLCLQSLQETESELSSSHGGFPTEWKWARVHPTEFVHAGRIPGLGSSAFAARGDQFSIFANTGDHGPVWKMVVSMDQNPPRAWGIYPGGQSGDPASQQYDLFMADWRDNHLRPLHFWLKPDESNLGHAESLTLEGAN